MKIQRKRMKYFAWGLCISLLLGNCLAPWQQTSAKNTVEGKSISILEKSEGKSISILEKSDSNRGVPAVPSSTGAIVTASPTVSPTASPDASATPTATPTSTPFMTPNPDATIRLGSQTSEKVKLTIGDQGVFDLDWSNTNIFYSSSLSQLTKVVYESSNSQVLSVTSEGRYQAVGVGEVTLMVTGYGIYGYAFEREYTVVVYPDMSKVTLEKSSITIYRTEYDYSDSSAKIKINSDYLINSYRGYDEEDAEITLTSSNDEMNVDFQIVDNVLTLTCSSEGSTKLTLVIYGKAFTIQLKVVVVKMSSSSLLLSQKQTRQLKVKGISGKLVWKSSNSKVASITSSGKVKAKQQGTTIISAQIEGCKVGCAVSVTTAKKKKAIARAQKIASTSQYSQAKRMQKGYYDCSSLVWRSYSPYGYKFGSAGYAPTAASIAQWMAGKGKLVKGGYSRKNVENLKLRAGDLMFETGASNGRYKGIYHVEMFIGYECCGFDSNGKAIVYSKWANRPTGYYFYGCGIVGRP